MVFKRLLFVAITLCLMAMPSAFAQDIIWSRTYGYPDNGELGLCGDLTFDSGYVISGVSYHFSDLSGEFWLVRTDANGDTLWTRNYGGERLQEAHYVIQTDDGGFAICGQTNVAVGDYDLYVVKTDSLGDTLWTQSFGISGQQDDGQAIVQTSDGGYLAVGSGWNGILSDVMMVRMDTSGAILWTKFYGASYSSDYGYGVIETADSGFAITGNYDSGSASNLWLLRTYPNGDTMWTRKFDFNNYWDVGEQIVMTSDGGFAISGKTFSSSSVYRLLILRTDSLGNEIWHSEFAGLGLAFAKSIDKTGDGGFVAAGGTRAGIAGSLDYYVVRVDSTGDSLWAAIYDYDEITGDDEDCYEVKVDAEGNIIAFGYADIDPSGGDLKYWILKLADNVSSGCDYVPGDINGDGSVMGNDVTYGVRYFKGLGDPPPDSCWNAEEEEWLYSAGDANGSCSFTGSDITFLVAYFKGSNPEILWCPQTPPAETSIILIKDKEKTPAIIPKE